MSEHVGGVGDPDPTAPQIKDNRRIDPVTGEVRHPAAAHAEPESPAEAAPSADAESALRAELAERTEDLQRLQAEYVNYRKRVDRDRAVARELALAEVVEAFVPVLDDLDAAQSHGELTGPLAAVAEKIRAALGRFGWQSYGAAGETFDPTVHEALMVTSSADVAEPTVAQVLQAGHRSGDRVVRAARVAVAEPETEPQAE